MSPQWFRAETVRALATTFQKLEDSSTTPLVTLVTGPAPVSLLTRRRFLNGAVILVCSAPVWSFLAGCSEGKNPGAPLTKTDGDEESASGNEDETETEPSDEEPGPQQVDGWDIPSGATLSPEDFACLAALCDVLIPGDSGSPGATECHAAWYLDQLLGAFNVTPPRIYAGGPYSGRHGGLDGFSQFLPLTRVEELRWRTYLEGSNGIADREWNGPVKGLRTRYVELFAALHQAAQKRYGTRFTLCDLKKRNSLLLSFPDQDTIQLAYEHTNEGTYGDPVYGGNFEMKGWKAIGFEGDRQPIGFTARQLLHPEEG